MGKRRKPVLAVEAAVKVTVGDTVFAVLAGPVVVVDARKEKRRGQAPPG